MSQFVAEQIVNLEAAGVSAVIDVTCGTPRVVYWGPSVQGSAEQLVSALELPVPEGGADVAAPLTVMPEQGAGFVGRPGIEGRRRDGSGWAPAFELQRVDRTPNGLVTISIDPQARLKVAIRLELDPTSGLLCGQAELTNVGADDYDLDALRMTLPVPAHATELLTFGGRWSNEFGEHRRPWPTGLQATENRRGRTSHDNPPVAFVGSAHFGETHGDVWGVHLGWSGNTSIAFDCLDDGRRYVQLAELLWPGEIVLAAGESHRTPWLYGSCSEAGIGAVSRRFHDHLRARPEHPTEPKPVLLNTWEAVYFDHDLDVLRRLADRAAEVGIERFVLDDGWFHGRRHDAAGLGDWWVDETMYPDGLVPLIDHVVDRGMEFGIWVEPEMVNPDSELHRAHPDWVLGDPNYEPTMFRHQLVLDLARREVHDYLLEKLDRLLSDHAISYVKWDMNRDLYRPASDGRANVHRQTRAVYELMSEIGTRHPDVAIESCSSGGGRIDFAVAEFTQRFWTSDCNDALDRVRIQRGASHLIPPELMGAHIGPERSHTTGRRHTLAFRGAVALFGHLGVEWDISSLDQSQLDDLSSIIGIHKKFRHLLHNGVTHRLERAGDATVAHAVNAQDRSEALAVHVQMASSTSLVAEPLRFPDLDPSAVYRVTHVPLGETLSVAVKKQPAWLREGLTLSGSQLGRVGVQIPILHPESAIVLHLQRI